MTVAVTQSVISAASLITPRLDERDLSALMDDEILKVLLKNQMHYDPDRLIDVVEFWEKR